MGKWATKSCRQKNSNSFWYGCVCNECKHELKRKSRTEIKNNRKKLSNSQFYQALEEGRF